MFVITCLMICSCKSNSGQQPASSDQTETPTGMAATILAFYKAYCTEFDGETKTDSILSVYCTDELREYVMDCVGEYDFVLNGGIYSEIHTESFRVVKQNEKYIVHFEYTPWPVRDEPAKDSVKGEKHSRQRSRSARRRSQRTGQKTENAPAEQKDETEGQETVKSEPTAKAEPVNSAETAKKEEAVKEQEPAGKADKKSKEKPAKKEEKNGRPDQARKAEKKTPAVTAAPKDLKEVEKKVKEVMDGAGFALEAEDHALIAEALVSSSTKNQFYQFFRKTKGEAAGREFYLKIRGQYESLKVLREA